MGYGVSGSYKYHQTMTAVGQSCFIKISLSLLLAMTEKVINLICHNTRHDAEQAM